MLEADFLRYFVRNGELQISEQASFEKIYLLSKVTKATLLICIFLLSLKTTMSTAKTKTKPVNKLEQL